MKRPLVLLLLTLVAATPAAAFAPAPDTAVVIEEVETTDHPDMTLIVSLSDELAGIEPAADELRITEGGVIRPATIEPIGSNDLQVVLVLDSSGSMDGGAATAAREAATRFLATMPSGVQVAVVTFAAKATVVSPLSTDTDLAAAEIAELDPSGETALYDAMLLATAQFDGPATGRRIVVLLSDGGDTASQATLADVEASLRDAGADFHAVELESADSDRTALESLATAAGGTVAPTTDPEGLTAVLDVVASRLVNRYRISYRSEAFDRGELAVQVTRDGVVATAHRTLTLPAAPPSTTISVTTTTVAVVVDTSVASPAGGLSGPATPIAVPWHQGTLGLQVGATAIFVAVAGLLIAFALRGPRTVTLTPAATTGPVDEPGSGTLSRIAGRTTGFADRSLRRGKRFEGLSKLLERAGLAIRPAEFAVVHLAIGVFALAAGALLIGPGMAPIAGLVGLLLVAMWLRRKARKRCAAFATQLPDILQLMSGGLRAGYGLMQTLESVSGSMPAPAGIEFRRAKTEIQLGKQTEIAMRDMAARMESEDFRWVVDALDIHRQVGGDLGEILDAVGETIRDRQRIKRRIKGLAAEGRISAYVLGALPFLVSGAVAVLNPGYFDNMIGTTVGRGLLIGSALLMTVGIVWMKRITALKF